MKSNFYFGSSDAPYPPTFSIVSPLPLPSFSPSRETCSPLLLSSPPSIFPAFPSSVRIFRARNVFATRFVSPSRNVSSTLLRAELRLHDLDYRKPGPCPFFSLFFSFDWNSTWKRREKGGPIQRGEQVWRKSNVFNRENVTDDGEGWINF